MGLNERPRGKPRGINSCHSRDLLIGNPESMQYCTYLDTRLRGCDGRGKPLGIKLEDKIK